MADNALLDALMLLLGRSPQPPQPIAPAVQPTPAAATPQPLLPPQNPGGPTAPSDQALIEAIRRKQSFAGAPPGPFPR